ncbi:hypothetical protein KNT87_gp084 [Erwinia phage Cronus]|uniref:Uncharacterized protein n=1 Tax=Erwinia phage Cronus TaxID=2163633 RepID=A0A2S1GME5_9CAUD|nr:hypothetical protein KNT87_gp084 [Erwinia phage Cronus]AWD90523.1 hypothetical protein [Erwinia phage Cronus]
MKLIETSMQVMMINHDTFFSTSFKLGDKIFELRDTGDQSRTFMIEANWYDYGRYDVIKVYEVTE